MSLKIVTKKERQEEANYSKGLIVGLQGTGKTYLLNTLDPKTTLFVDLEAGDMSVKRWEGEYTLRPENWEEFINLSCLLGGPDYSVKNGVFSENHYNNVVEAYGKDLQELIDKKIKTIFVDSISDASMFAMRFANASPEAISEKTGKFNKLGAYGLVRETQENVLKQIQRARNKNVWFTANLVVKTDPDTGLITKSIDMYGSVSTKLPYIVDHVLILENLPKEDRTVGRRLICKKESGEMLVKTRSSALDVYEKPDLGELQERIMNGKLEGEETNEWT